MCIFKWWNFYFHISLPEGILNFGCVQPMSKTCSVLAFRPRHGCCVIRIKSGSPSSWFGHWRVQAVGNINSLNPKMEVWFRWFSFSIIWCLGCLDVFFWGGDFFTDCDNGKSPLCTTSWEDVFLEHFSLEISCQYPKKIAGLYRAFVARGDGGLHNSLIRPYLKDDDGVGRWHLGWQILRFPTGYDRLRVQKITQATPEFICVFLPNPQHTFCLRLFQHTFATHP